MKKFKKFVSLLAVAAIMAVVPNANAMEVEAASKVVYVMYDEDLSSWRMQVGEWDEEDAGMEICYLNEGDDKLNDGDTVVVLPNEDNGTGDEVIEIDARLGNLTINRATAMVSVKGGVQDYYVFGDSYTAITGDVTNGYVYDNACCTFNSNVSNLRIISSDNQDAEAIVTAIGTVSYFAMENENGLDEEYYNFAPDSFYYHHDLATDDDYYSTDGNGPAPAAPAPSTPEAPATPSTPAQNTPSSEYDDVPKTGENNLVVWMFTASAICMAGSVMLRKKLTD